MANKTFSAPLAVIKVGGIAVGKMRNLRYTENIRRQTVKGIGKITGGESQVTDFSATLNVGAFTMDLRKSILEGAIPRIAQTTQQWEDTVVLNDVGIQIVVLRKVARARNPVTGLITVGYDTFVTIDAAFSTREDFDITEGQVSGRNADFDILTPFIFPI